MLVDFHSMFALDGEYRKFEIRSDRTTSVEVKPDQKDVDGTEGGIRTHLQFRELEAAKEKIVSECWDRLVWTIWDLHARASASKERQPRLNGQRP